MIVRFETLHEMQLETERALCAQYVDDPDTLIRQSSRDLGMLEAIARRTEKQIWLKFKRKMMYRANRYILEFAKMNPQYAPGFVIDENTLPQAPRFPVLRKRSPQILREMIAHRLTATE